MCHTVTVSAKPKLTLSALYAEKRVSIWGIPSKAVALSKRANFILLLLPLLSLLLSVHKDRLARRPRYKTTKRLNVQPTSRAKS
jgi:hypothetical protein